MPSFTSCLLPSSSRFQRVPFFAACWLAALPLGRGNSSLLATPAVLGHTYSLHNLLVGAPDVDIHLRNPVLEDGQT